MIEVTAWAREILEKAHRAATRLNPDASIRLARTAGGVETILAEAPEAADTALELEGMTLWIENGLEGLLDVEEPHDRLILRPLGSEPNPRPHA